MTFLIWQDTNYNEVVKKNKKFMIFSSKVLTKLVGQKNLLSGHSDIKTDEQDCTCVNISVQSKVNNLTYTVHVFCSLQSICKTYTCLIYLFVATHSDHTGHTGFVDGPNHVAGETLRPESKT